MKGLESVLLSTPSILLFGNDEEEKEEMKSLICKIVTQWKETVLNEEEEDNGEREWKKTCAKTLGSLLGRSLSDADPTTCVMDDDDDMKVFMKNDILVPLLSSSTAFDSTTTSTTTMGYRYDQMALAQACHNGTEVLSREIVSFLVTTLFNLLQQGGVGSDATNHPAMSCAQTLSFMFHHGGTHPIQEFHNLSSYVKEGGGIVVTTTPMDIIVALCQKQKSSGDSNGSGGGGQIALGMSRLYLPQQKERIGLETSELMKLSYTILPHILPAYNNHTPSSEINSIIQFVSQVIPPLTEWDELKLCTALPILATALQHNHPKNESLKEIITSLAEYAISTDHDCVEAKSAAASIVFSVMLHHQENGDNECIGRLLLRDVISPAVAQNRNMNQALLGKEEEKENMDELQSFINAFEGAMNLLALVGSATACRGGKSSQTCDLVVRFLIKLACTGSAPFPDTNEEVCIGTSSSASSSSYGSVAESLSIIAGSSFGAILSVENGGAFWRQRISHVSLPEILRACDDAVSGENGSGSQDDSAASSFINFPLGALTAACHIMCCVPTTTLGDKQVNELGGIAVRGLICCATRMSNITTNENKTMTSSNVMSVTSIVLASLLRLMVVAPIVMARYASSMVPHLLLICQSFKSKVDVARHIIALQCLINIPLLPDSKKVCEAYKAHVLTYVLDTLDSSCRELRKAAVQVRNTWSTLE
uniref:MMS19 nucleotide excision repair protein n=1 Tax=Ditylum brightwellii TaxID=49249 RepID=A0A7S1YT85_9STRA